MPHDVTMLGSITRDRDPISAQAARWGGVPTYAGITLARRGLRVGLVSNLAAPDHSPARRLLEAEGLLCRFGDSDHNTTFINAYPGGDVRRQTIVSTARPITPEDFQPLPSHPGIIYLGPVHERDIDPATYRRCFDSAATLALDIQGLLRLSAVGPVVEQVTDTLRRMNVNCRFLKLSQHEFDILAAHFGVGPRDLLRRWNVDEMLITMGSKGGVIVTAATSVDFAPPTIATPPSPTGAGDVMFSAYIAARTFDRLCIERAAQTAAHVAGRQVAGEHIRPTALVIAEDERAAQA